MKRKNYNKAIRITIFIMALLFLIGAVDGYLEVQDGETVWNAPQILRVALSAVFALSYAYIACFTEELARKTGWSLHDNAKFSFLLFIMIVILFASFLLMPAS